MTNNNSKHLSKSFNYDILIALIYSGLKNQKEICMIYRGKDIQRALRSLNGIYEDLVQSNSDSFLNISEIFIHTIGKIPVLEQFIKPYFEMEISFNDIIISDDDDVWQYIKLPLELDSRIAFVLQFLKDITENNKNIDSLLYYLYRHKKVDENYFEFNQRVISSALRELIYKISDFIEDNVECSEQQFQPEQLKIINIGTINNNNGYVAVGERNIQSQHDVNSN